MNYYLADLPLDPKKAERLLRIKMMVASREELQNLVLTLYKSSCS
jgi:hypothetical protein